MMQNPIQSDPLPRVFALSENATYCDVGASIIAMNTASDRYLLIAGRQAGWFHELRLTRSAADLSPEAGRFASILEMHGILAPRNARGRLIVPFSYPQATASLIDTPAPHVANVSPIAALRFLQAFLRAKSLQGPGPVTPHLAAVRSWKQRLPSHVGAAGAPLASYVLPYQTLSTLFVTTQDACLPRSLLLLAYLALRGVRADLVFGVRLSPFMAHCWVQQGRTVLNDHLENTASFTQIFAA
ncbi:MAG: lasso peptide biosynthesis B2 protein [Pannonibacter sp.]